MAPRKKWYLKATRSQVAKSGIDTDKPGMKEHPTCEILKDNATG